MRVLLSALALTALLLLAGAASVFAADGALPGDAPVTLDPVEPIAPPTPDAAGSTVATVTQAAEPATQPVTEAVVPVVAAVAEAAAPLAGPVGDTVEPIVDPVVDVVAPVAAPIVDVVAPAAGAVDPVVSPIVDVVAPVIQPILDVVAPVVGPIVDVVDPVVDPGIDPVPPLTGAGDRGTDSAGLAAVTAPVFDPNSVLSRDVAWFDGDSSIGSRRSNSTSDLVVARTGIAPAETGASMPGSPGDLPWRGAPFGLPSGGAGPGGALTLGAWIALLTAGLLAIVFYAFRRPWSSVPTLRGRSLLPALRPA